MEMSSRVFVVISVSKFRSLVQMVKPNRSSVSCDRAIFRQLIESAAELDPAIGAAAV